MEAAMKNHIIDNIVKVLIVEMLALFGLRGVLPAIVADGYMPVLLASGIAIILGYSIGQFTYQCEPTCDANVCKAL